MTIPFLSKLRTTSLFREYDPERIRQRTGLWWRILIGTAGAVILCAALYGAWLLWEAVFSGASPQGSLPEAETLSREALQTVLSGFEQRAARYEFMVENPPAIVDPAR